MQSTNKDENIQVDIREPEKDNGSVKIRPLERVKITPLVPPEASSYGKNTNYSRPWILHDGRDNPLKGSEMHDKYKPMDYENRHSKVGKIKQSDLLTPSPSVQNGAQGLHTLNHHVSVSVRWNLGLLFIC